MLKECVLTLPGNVGIGTTSPGYKLQVGDNGVGDGNIAMKANGVGADAGAELTFNMNVGGGNADSYIAQIVPISYDSLSSGTHNSLNFKVGTWNNNADAGVSRMTILSNGNIGIGTTDPGTARLAVIGGNVGIGTTLPGSKLHVVDGNNYAKLGDLHGNSTMSLRMADNSGFPVEVQAYGTELRFNTATTTGATPSVKMNILPNGNVGIGETSPQAKFDVYDTFTKTAANPNTVEVFHTGSVTTNNIYPVAGLFTQRVSGSANVYATGLVGVAEKLGDYGYIARGVQGIGKLSGNITVNNADMQYMGVEGRIEMEGSNSVNLDDRAYSFYGTAEIDSGSHLKEYHGLYLNTPTNNGTILNKYGVSQVDANSINYFAGNVGIGTTTPLAKLDIQGTQGQLFSVTDDLSGSIFAVADISGVPIFDVNSSGVSYFDGNVGIGTATPTTTTGIKLDVIGGIGAWAANNTSTLKLFNGRLVGAGRQITNLVSTNGNGSLELYRSDNLLNALITGAGNSYLNGGNVGIGTTLPIGKFNVSKDSTTDGLSQAITVSSSSVSTKRMNLGYVPGSNYAFIDVINYAISNTNQALSLQPNGGNVGIGTTSPSSFNSRGRNLVVNSNGDTGITISANTTSSSTLLFADAFAGTGGTAAYRGAIEYDHANDSMAFSTSATERMHIDSSGNVGIGPSTTSPSHKLEVRDGTISGEIAKFSAIGATVVIESSTAGNAKLFLKPNTTGSKRAEFRVTDANDYGFLWTADTSANGTAYMDLDTSTTGGGDLTVKGDVIAYGSPSDKKYKENIKPIESRFR